MIEDLYLASCCIALFCSGLIFKQHKTSDNNSSFLHSGFFALLIIPLTGYIGVRYGELPDFIIKLSQCVILLFCALIFLHYQRKKASFYHITLHMLPFTVFFLLRISDIATHSLGLVIVYFVVIFSYLATSIFAFSTVINMRSKYELANIVTVIAIVCLAGLVTFCYLNNSPWILPLWHMLNLLICCYITISAFNAAYTPKKAEELGINKALTIKKERLLDKETANSLSQQVIRLFTANKVYLDNALCLKKLSAQLNLTTHQTSELLNVHMKSSFYRLLNSYRVQHACNLLKDQKNAFTITDIMYNSGFNNKNTFYKEFKRHTGTSPSQWVKHNAREAKDLIQQLS